MKEAFEAIKIQKGLMVPQGFIYDDDGRSMRPNPSQFMSDDDENINMGADYKMYE